MKTKNENKSGVIKWLLIIVAAALLVFICWKAGWILNGNKNHVSEQEKQKAIQEANNKVSNLKEAQSLIQELIDDLNAEIVNIMTDIGIKEDEIAEKEEDIAEKEQQIIQKQADIDVTEQEYYEAKAREEKQKDDMVIRVRRIYETDTSSILNMILRGSGFGSLLNRMDYAEQLYSYDRNKLEEYEETRQLVKDLWDRLETEKQELQAQKAQFEIDREQLTQAKQELSEQKADLDKALAARKKENAGYDAEIKKARQEASVAKTLLQQEQKELKKLQEAQMQGKTSAATGTYTDTGYTSIVDSASGSDLGKRVAKYALQFLGNPYVMGGTSLTKGTDCSGFTQHVYADFGYKISRSSSSQRSNGVSVSY